MASYQEQQPEKPASAIESLEENQQVESVDTLVQPEANLDQAVQLCDRSMRVIMPGTSSCAVKVILTMKLLDEFLSLSSTRQVLDEILNPIKKGEKKKRLKKTKQKVSNRDKQTQQPLQRPEIFMNTDAVQSLRYIQAGRYEIFVQSHNKKAYVFDWLCEQVWSMSLHRSQQAQTGDTEVFEPYKSSHDMKVAIVQYAIQQAERDDRITANIKDKRSMSYDNFSLIVSYDPVMAQPKHIDLLYPNFQYGLIITDKSPGTTVYTPSHYIRTVTDVKNHVWTDMSSTMAMAMEQDAIVTTLLSQFGAVLCPNIKQVQYWEPMNEGDVTVMEQSPTTNDDIGSSNDASTIDSCFLTGTLLSLPGSEIHAGPSSSKYRTVLFFSACPDVTNTIPYHPDTQYFAPLLCCDLVSLLWSNLGIKERIYLLNRLIESINETKCQHLERHIADTKLIQFLKTVAKWDEKKKRLRRNVATSKKYKNMKDKYKTMDDYINAFASRGKPIETESIGIDVVGVSINNCGHSEHSHRTSTVTESINPLDYQNTIKLISCSNLVVEFEGEYFPAQVFESQPSMSTTSSKLTSHDDDTGEGPEERSMVNVMLYYPVDQSWEGNVNPYTLEWKQEWNIKSAAGTLNGEIEELHKRRRFDGMNGVLHDNEGIVVPCYPRFISSVSSQDTDSTMKVQQKPKKRRKSIIPDSVRPRKRVKATKIKTASLPMSVGPDTPPIIISDNITIVSKTLRDYQVSVNAEE